MEAPSSELEAVNTILAAIGEAPVNSIVSGELPAQVKVAVDLLRDTSRKVQLTGYHFNVEEDFEIARTIANEVILPGNCIDADLTDENCEVDVCIRGGKLYDKKKHTFTFTFNPKLTITLFLAWTDLPESAREYIKIKAARIYQDRYVGASENHAYTQQDEVEAFSVMNRSNAENEDASIFDTYDIGSIVRRRRVFPRTF